MDSEAFIHFVGGALGGTAGTALTCPLEVVKTRLQSTDYATTLQHSITASTSKTPVRTYRIPMTCRMHSPFQLCTVQRNTQLLSKSSVSSHQQKNLFTLFRNIIANEGFRALFKGLGPNLVGVAPSKAVYFYTYSTCKRLMNGGDLLVPNSAMIHMSSAAAGGFVAATVVNPVWLVKTRLQLHKGPLTLRECIRRVWQTDGIRGFYRGVTASYVGISETVIQFVLYEEMRILLLKTRKQAAEQAMDLMSPKVLFSKQIEGSQANSEQQSGKFVELTNQRSLNEGGKRDMIDFLQFMLAGGTAKFIACVLAYPHEVVRTRMREITVIPKGFMSILMGIIHREGFLALYRGLTIQLLRTVPNTAITMGTYELTVYMLHKTLTATEA